MEKPNNHVVEDDGWLTPKEIAPKIRMSKSGLYSLIRRGSTIPYVRISKKKILLNWASVDQWLHDVEAKKKRANFEE